MKSTDIILILEELNELIIMLYGRNSHRNEYRSLRRKLNEIFERVTEPDEDECLPPVTDPLQREKDIDFARGTGGRGGLL